MGAFGQILGAQSPGHVLRALEMARKQVGLVSLQVSRQMWGALLFAARVEHVAEYVLLHLGLLHAELLGGHNGPYPTTLERGLLHVAGGFLQIPRHSIDHPRDLSAALPILSADVEPVLEGRRVFQVVLARRWRGLGPRHFLLRPFHFRFYLA
jgi:hypothetical protein